MVPIHTRRDPLPSASVARRKAAATERARRRWRAASGVGGNTSPLFPPLHHVKHCKGSEGEHAREGARRGGGGAGYVLRLLKEARLLAWVEGNSSRTGDQDERVAAERAVEVQLSDCHMDGAHMAFSAVA